MIKQSHINSTRNKNERAMDDERTLRAAGFRDAAAALRGDMIIEFRVMSHVEAWLKKGSRMWWGWWWQVEACFDPVILKGVRF